jgi:hypothetical protein
MSKKLDQLSLFPLTSSVGDFPAKTSAQQERAQALLAIARDCGVSSIVLWEILDLVGLSSRTSPAPGSGGSTKFVARWESEAMKRFRSLCQQRMSERLTSGAESLLLPTPLSRDWKGPSSEGGKHGQGSLPNAMAKLYPTPTASAYGSSNNGDPQDGRGEYATKGNPSLWTMAKRGMLPTPTAGDSKASGSRRREGSQAHPGVSLTDVVVHGRKLEETHGARQKNRGRLSPQFVEWLMGLPIGWTEVG